MLTAKRWFLSFAACLVGYIAYAYLVAPFFEPPPLKITAGATPLATTPKRARNFDYLFAPDAWQRDPQQPPKVIETDQCTLLLQDYRPIGAGQMELKPCTLIFYMDEAGESQQPGDEGRKRRPVVLDAPGGAVLIFDRDLDLARAEFGRLMGGKLRGEISIYSPPTRTDTADDFELKTRNLQIDENRVWTPHEVTFRYGNSHGSGRDLAIQLVKTGGGGKTPTFSGISQMQLSQVDKIHVDLAGANLFMDAESPPDQAEERTPQPPVEVRCKGPFRFDFTQHLASFDDRVEVRRVNPVGDPDKLLCQRLTFILRDPNLPLPAAQQREGALGKAAEKLRRITAEGNPAVIQGPTMSIEVRAARIDYDLESGRMVLAPSPSLSQVLMHYQESQLSAHQVEYELGEEGKIGRLLAEGPGKLIYVKSAAGTGPQQMTAQWQRELRIRPHENNQVISLLGQAKVGVGDMGSFAADELHLWAVETPLPAMPQSTASPKKSGLPALSVSLRPDRLLALRNVQIDSTRLTGHTQRLEAWFTPSGASAPSSSSVPANAASVAPAPANSALGNPATTGNVSPGVPVLGNPGSPGKLVSNSSTLDSRTSSPPGLTPASPMQPLAGTPNPFAPRSMMSGLSPSASDEPTSRYDVTGDLIRLQWIVDGSTPEANNLVLQDLSVEGTVRITEIETAKPDEDPLLVTGTAVQVRNASAPDASLQLIGKPAKLSARGLSLSGAIVNVHKGQNRAWIDGPGLATLPIPANLAVAPGQKQPAAESPSPPPTAARLTWQGNLNFDGQTITVTKDIALASDNQTASAQLMEVTLARRLDFAQPQSEEPTEIAKLMLDGGVALENRSLDPTQREIASQDSLRTRNLFINRLTGELKADGPGWVSTARRGSALPAAPGAGPAPSPLAPAASPLGNSNGLSYLYVEFDQGIVGNINQHRVRFVGKVRTVFGPITDFNQRLETVTDDRLPEQAVRLVCDDLQITEMVFPNNHRWMELAAQGNTEVEGQTFNARAARIAYTTEKEQLVLDGDGRMDAQIWYRSGPGKPRAYQAARKIMYWRKTNQIDIEGGGAGTLDQLQGIALPKVPGGAR